MIPRRLTYVPTLGHENADKEKGKKNTSPNPSVSGIGRTFIEIGLVYLVDHVQSASLDRATELYCTILFLALMSARSLQRKESRWVLNPCLAFWRHAPG